MEHDEELDRLLGPVAVMDLEQRGLLVEPGRGTAPPAAAGEEDRIAGALFGLALALPTPFVTAWADALLADGRAAAPAFARRLAAMDPGRSRATARAIRRLRRGVPWHSAAPDSEGDAALPRAVIDGLVWRRDPAWRPVSAGLGTVVTHAHPRAVAAAVEVADLVAGLVLDPASVSHDGPAVLPDPVRRTAASTLAAVRAIVADHPDPVAAVERARRVHRVAAALVGALVGARDGTAAFPAAWRARLADREALEGLAARLAGRPRPTTGEPGDTHIWFLVDRSGSMASFGDAVVEGVNQFIDEQRQASPRTRLTLAQFDGHEPFEVVIDARRLERVHLLGGFEPRGTTPLYDAIGSLLDRAEHRGRDEDHLVVILTDGMENASRRWTQPAIFDRIAAAKEAGWTFAFLGTNQDSYAVGHGLGVAEGSISNYAPSPEGWRLAAASASRATTSWARKSAPARRRSRDDFFEGRKEAEGGS